MTFNFINLMNFSSVMKNIGGVLLAIAILLVMVTIHEFGHYIAGKILNFKINEFSVGFGPAIFKKRNKKTGELFALRLIPLGGYCAFDGEDEVDENDKNIVSKTGSNNLPKDEPFQEMNVEKKVEEHVLDRSLNTVINEKSDEESIETKDDKNSKKNKKEENYPEPVGVKFNDQAPWKRIIVLVAGATMNYLLAVVLIIIMFASFGQVYYKASFEKPKDETLLTTVEKVDENELPMIDINPSTDKSKLMTGDVIVKINGKRLYLITDYIKNFKGKKAGDIIKMGVIRQVDDSKKEITVDCVLKEDAAFKNMTDVQVLLKSMGVTSLSPVQIKSGFFDTIGHSFMYSFKIAESVFMSLGELFTGKIGLKSLGGPITTIKITSESATNGLMPFLNISAFIGVNLALLNLMPLPALDGLKAIFTAIEWIRKKPINRNVEATIHFVGIIVLFAFAIFVDIIHWF